ncbi:unnamed protein product [Rotaria socialis]|nr:unnamed protein product [Rotaria socialis]
MQEFVHIHQEENQSVTSFYEHVIRKYRKARQCITEQQVITVLQTGVKNSLKEYLIRNEKDITKPDEWLQYARQEEYIQKRTQQQRNNFYSETTNQPFFEPMLQTTTIQSRSLNAKSLGQQPITPHHNYQQQHQHTAKFNNNRMNEKQIRHPNIKSSRPSYPETKMHRSDTPQEALIDTGSAITIIHECLLKNILHKNLIKKTKNHLSANCSTLNVIGETTLEINIHGLKTEVIADVATNLITDLILGSDWIQRNKVYILTPEQRIMIRSKGKEVSTPFITPPILNYPATLTNHITIPPFSEHMVEAKVPQHNRIDVLFEPNPRLKNKALFIASALLHIEDKRIRISIINATDRQQTLSKGTKLGIATQIAASIGVTMPLNNVQERIPKGKAYIKLIQKGKEANIISRLESKNMQMITSPEEQHQCRECKQYFDTGNELFKHLRIKCYSEEIREQIN